MLLSIFTAPTHLKDALCLRSAAERIEHIKKHEAGESHGGVSLRSTRRSVGHLPLKHPQGAQDDDAGREEDIDNQRPGNHRLLHVPRPLLEHVLIHGLYAQRLRRWSIHNNIDPEDLHGVQGIRDSHQRGKCNKRQSCNGRAQLEPHKVPNVVEDGLSLLDSGTTKRIS